MKAGFLRWPGLVPGLVENHKGWIFATYKLHKILMLTTLGTFSEHRPFISDCNAPVSTGYSYTYTETTYEATASVTCATGYEGTATPVNVKCQATGQWESVSGCDIKGMSILF